MADQPSTWRRIENVAALLVPWILVRRFIEAWRWAYAGYLNGEGRYEEALRLARRMRGSLRRGLEWQVFEIQQLALLRWDHETIDTVNALVLQYEYPTPRSPPSPAIEFDFSEIVLSGVSARYKNRYPLTIHPSWDEASPFFPNNRIRRQPAPKPPLKPNSQHPKPT